MTKRTEPSSESELPPGDLDGGSAPDSPVVVIHYRDRGVPLWLIVPLVFIVPTATILIYHRLVAVRIQQAAMAELRAINAAPPADVVVPPAVPEQAKPPEPLALNSQPIAPGTDGPTAPAPATKPAAPALAAVPAPPLATAPVPALITPTAPVAVTPPVKLETSAPVVGSNSGTPAAPVPLPPPDAAPPVERVKTANALIDLGEPTALDRASGRLMGGTAPTSLAPAGGPGAVGASEPNLADTVAKPAAEAGGRPVAVPGAGGEMARDPQNDRLPTKEETEREIAAESRRKQAEIENLEAKRQSDLRETARNDRVAFRAELLDTLKLHGNRAGFEIDKLVRRYTYDTTSDSYRKAQYTWRASRIPTVMKVRYTRSLDIPEVAILDFLSDQIHPRIGSRGGPRDRNDVRIRAARTLLSFDVSLTDVNTAAAAAPAAGVARPPVQPVRGGRRPVASDSNSFSTPASGVARRSQ